MTNVVHRHGTAYSHINIDLRKRYHVLDFRGLVCKVLKTKHVTHKG